MIRKRLKAPSPALIVSIIALVVALAGTSYAAGFIGTAQLKNNAVTNPKLAKLSVGFQKIRFGAIHTENIQNNAVGTGQLANNAVTTGQLGNNAVTTGKIANNAVTTGQIADAAVTSTKIGAGQVRAGNLGNTTSITGAGVPIAAGGEALAFATCPAGTRLLSGGGFAGNVNTHPYDSFPSGNSWVWIAHNYGGATTLFASALCLAQ